MKPVFVTFTGGHAGQWRVELMDAVRGDPLSAVDRVKVAEGRGQLPSTSSWTLRGVTSNERYVGVGERAELTSRQRTLGRNEATLAALIPISKSEEWWEMTQEERLEVFTAQSRHIQVGLEYLPAVARRLHHCRDMGNEQFDFLTWFEYPVESADAFEELVRRIRDTPEWGFVTHEIDIRLSRVAELP